MKSVVRIAMLVAFVVSAPTAFAQAPAGAGQRTQCSPPLSLWLPP